MQIVAASFQALQASESVVRNGYTPLSAVASVALYAVVMQPGNPAGEAQPWYNVPGGRGGGKGGDGGSGAAQGQNR